MKCSGCGNESAYRLSYSAAGESCDSCGAPASSFKFSDVFFRGPYHDQHIADPDRSPKGTFVRSREHKAALMAGLGIREVGDKVHGARDRY